MKPEDWELAAARRAIHPNARPERNWTRWASEIGIAGERHFSDVSGYPMKTDLSGTDGGIDFWIVALVAGRPRLFSIDVKTRRNPRSLILDPDRPGRTRVFADLFVLARYDVPLPEPELLGWQWGQILRRAPWDEIGEGSGDWRRCLARETLRPMADLLDRLVPFEVARTLAIYRRAL